MCSIANFFDKPGPSGTALHKQPVLFIGHGSPLNAVEKNSFSLFLQKLGNKLPAPKAILCISAHWETKGSLITASENPSTIHDFVGFPKQLHEFTYPAPGSKWLANRVVELLSHSVVELDYNWGFDHGCWSVLSQLFPNAEIPVVQLSLDIKKSPEQHFELAKMLLPLRFEDVLIIGSGNIVHNKGLMRMNNPPFDWATVFIQKIKEEIINNNYHALINYQNWGTMADLSVPTNEHFIPLLYALALKCNDDSVDFFNEEIILGSVAMHSVKFE